MRAGVHPQQLFRSETTRAVDVGVGYRLGSRDGQTEAHGPYAELAFFPWVRESGKSVTRVGVRNVGEGLYDTEGRSIGWGASSVVTAELATFVSGAFATASGGSAVAGAAHGEIGLGLFAGVGHTDVRGIGATYFTAGLSGRLPATVGFVCCAKRLTAASRRGTRAGWPTRRTRSPTSGPSGRGGAKPSPHLSVEAG